MTDSSTDLAKLLPAVREIAKAASREILEVYATDFAVAEKQDRSPLTEADLAAHETIVRGLEALTPEVPILSEESSNVPFSERSSWPLYWLVDPLDGTKEFIKKNGEFTGNIALVREHRAVLGVVHVPVTGASFFAAAGLGAFKQENDAAEPVAIRPRKPNRERLVVSGSRSHVGDLLEKFVRGLPGQVELISKGSSLKLCMVAEGLADIYPRLGPTSEWDTAAAQCVVEQAGGIVVDLQFEPLLYNAKDDILNPHFLVIGDPSFGWRELMARFE